MVNGCLELEAILGKVSSKTAYEIGLFHVVIHHNLMTSRKLRILFAHYTNLSFFFKVLFHELIFWKHFFSYLSCRGIFIKYTSEMIALSLLIFLHPSIFLSRKNFVAEFHVYNDIYRVRKGCYKLYSHWQSSISFPFLRLTFTKKGKCVKSKNTIARFIVSPRNI